MYIYVHMCICLCIYIPLVTEISHSGIYHTGTIHVCSCLYLQEF